MRLRQRGYGFSMDTLSRFVLHWGAKLWHVNCVEIDSCLQIPIYSTSQEVTNFSGFPFTMLSAVGLIDFQHFFVDDQGYRVAGCRSGIWYNLAHQVFINGSWIFRPENQSCREIPQGFTGETGLTVSGNDFGTRCQNESFRRVPSLKLT